VSPASIDVTVARVTDFAALEATWRDLETRSDPSFFQTWTWTGCLAEERFPDPVLVEAREDGRTVALALFNRDGRTLYLGETGDPAIDGIYIEFNGVLTEPGREASLTTACLRAARAGHGRWFPLAGSGRRRLVLGGVSASTANWAAEAGHVRCIRSQSAPSVDLTDRGRCFLGSRSTNTRQQLRRSIRHYDALGDIVLHRAESLAQAHDYLDQLISLHQASWIARGQPGAFATPFFGRFHRALIARGLERGEIDLLQVKAGAQTVGLLYNFRHRRHSLAYQSGFDYDSAGRHGKPGMTCHHEAIRFAAGWGAVSYEFLAGDDRYKRSLSDRAETLHWIEVADQYSPDFLARRAWDFLTSRRRFAAADPIGRPQ
jgi:CelD/BcsL family acetyltransferase involved in cellulose biosynthesis